MWSPQAASSVAISVASSTAQTGTSTTVGTIDVECTLLDLCAQQIENPRWIAFNVDTAAGGTVWPLNAGFRSSKSKLQNFDV